MITTLKETVKLFKKLNNSKLVNKKLSEHIFEEEDDKLRAFEKALNEYSNFLKSSNQKELDCQTSRDLLATIHMELMSFVHYIDEVDELLGDVLKRIPLKNE